MRSSCLAKSSRPVSPYSRRELNSLLTKGVISPAMVLWMLGGSSKSALGDDEPRELQPNWKIAALVVTIVCGGISIAGMLPIGNKSEAAISATDIEEAQGHKPLRITARVMSNLNRTKDLAAGRSTSVSAGFDPANLSDRTVPAARPALPMWRQRVLEFHRSTGYSRPITLAVQADPVPRPALSPQRQPALEFHRSIGSSRLTSLPFQAMPVAPPTLPTQRHPALEFRRSIANSHLLDSYNHYLDRYSSGTSVDIATASIDEPKTPIREAVSRTETATDAEIKSGLSSSNVPKPRRAVRTTVVRRSAKKAEDRCYKGFIWGCRAKRLATSRMRDSPRPSLSHDGSGIDHRRR